MKNVTVRIMYVANQFDILLIKYDICLLQLTAARKKRYGDAPFQNIPASDPAAPEDVPSTTFYSFSPKFENL
jgi:hypothetical protein